MQTYKRGRSTMVSIEIVPHITNFIRLVEGSLIAIHPESKNYLGSISKVVEEPPTICTRVPLGIAVLERTDHRVSPICVLI